MPKRPHATQGKLDAVVGRFRTVIGEAGVEVLLKAMLKVMWGDDRCSCRDEIRCSEFERVIVDTTAQEKR